MSTSPSKAGFVNILDIGRCHADGAVGQVIERVHYILDDRYQVEGAAVRQICLYFGVDFAVEPLDHDGLLIAFTGKLLNAVACNQGLKVRVENILALFGL